MPLIDASRSAKASWIEIVSPVNTDFSFVVEVCEGLVD